MKNYEELHFQLISLENEDVITSSTDNVGGANGYWDGWDGEE